MGIYNSQYESYYGSIYNKKRNIKSTGSMPEIKILPQFSSEYIIKKLTLDLIGVLILTILVISSKLIITPETTAAYKYSKKIVNEGYSAEQIISAVKSFSYRNFEKSAMKWIEEFKATVVGGKPYETKLKEDFILPVAGTVTQNYSEGHRGIHISVEENSAVKASFAGTVAEFGEDKEQGKYILINHGDGLDTKYCNLNSIDVKKGDKVTEGQIIGKSGGKGNSDAPHLHFEVLYMGENLNPADYMFVNQL